MNSENNKTPKRESIARWKRLLYLAAAALVALLTAGALLEGFIRLLMPQQEMMTWMKPDPRYGHLMRPNFHQAYPFVRSDFRMDVRTNSHGFRDTELRPAKENEKTIVFLGDSFAFGYGVNIQDRFDTQLGVLLQNASKPYRLVNLAVNGWGTLQETMYLRDHLDLYEPDLVVFSFCPNDPSDDVFFKMKGQSYDKFMFPGKRFLRNHSHLFRFLNLTASKALQAVSTWGSDRPGRQRGVLPKKRIWYSEKQWKDVLGVFQAFQRDFALTNPKGRILIQATSPTFEDFRTHLTAIAQSIGALYVDNFDAVNALPVPQRRLPHDTHWSPMMHTISAKGLFDALMKMEQERRPAH